MLKIACLAVLLVAVSAQLQEEKYGPPAPYSYSYDSELEGGRTSRSESTDGNGIIIGSYSIIDDDGRQRIVEYTAGPDGFQANIKTNEPGTKSEPSAGVQIEANPIEIAPGAPTSYARAPAPAIAIRPQSRPITYVSAAPQARPISYVSAAPQARPISYISGGAAQPQIVSLGAQQGAYDPSRYVLVPLDQAQRLRAAGIRQ